jgi:hypothetical protein
LHVIEKKKRSNSNKNKTHTFLKRNILRIISHLNRSRGRLDILTLVPSNEIGLKTYFTPTPKDTISFNLLIQVKQASAIAAEVK